MKLSFPRKRESSRFKKWIPNQVGNDTIELNWIFRTALSQGNLRLLRNNISCHPEFISGY